MNTLGHPLPGMEVKVCDPETGERVPAGVVGELCFKSYALFDGYYKEPELTAAAFDDESFFRSQDLADRRRAARRRDRERAEAHGAMIGACQTSV